MCTRVPQPLLCVLSDCQPPCLPMLHACLHLPSWLGTQSPCLDPHQPPPLCLLHPHCARWCRVHYFCEQGPERLYTDRRRPNHFIELWLATCVGGMSMAVCWRLDQRLGVARGQWPAAAPGCPGGDVWSLSLSPTDLSTSPVHRADPTTPAMRGGKDDTPPILCGYTLRTVVDLTMSLMCHHEHSVVSSLPCCLSGASSLPLCWPWDCWSPSLTVAFITSLPIVLGTVGHLESELSDENSISLCWDWDAHPVFSCTVSPSTVRNATGDVSIGLPDGCISKGGREAHTWWDGPRL